jgi:hypothetical protein
MGVYLGDDSMIWDREQRVAFDPAKVRKLEHKGMPGASSFDVYVFDNDTGKYFKMSGRYQTHPSPQRCPVLFQAVTSKSGRSFASKHAEGEFLKMSH